MAALKDRLGLTLFYRTGFQTWLRSATKHCCLDRTIQKSHKPQKEPGQSDWVQSLQFALKLSYIILTFSHIFLYFLIGFSCSSCVLSLWNGRPEAIGRARRHGQKRDVVHVWCNTQRIWLFALRVVYQTFEISVSFTPIIAGVESASLCLDRSNARRFVTADTLEQQITEQHQGALWKVEQQRQREEGAEQRG